MREYKIPLIFGAIMTLGLAFVLWAGLEPKAVRKIKLSQFEQPLVASNAILLRLRQEMTQVPVMMLGIDPQHPEAVQVVNEMLKGLKTSSLAYQQVWVDADLSLGAVETMGDQPLVFSFSQDPNRVAAGMKNAIQTGSRVLVLTGVEMATSFQAGSPAWKLRQENSEFLTILFADFPRTRDAEKDVKYPCRTGDDNPASTGRLGCEILTAARLNYRKEMPVGKMVGLMSQISQFDYLMLLSTQK